MSTQSLHIQGSRKTPEVILDLQKDMFKLSGMSMPENAGEFYGPVIEWLRENRNKISPDSVLTFELEYFNSSSMKALYMVLTAIKDENGSHCFKEVRWVMETDDDPMAEAGETLAELAEVNMSFIHIDK